MNTNFKIDFPLKSEFSLVLSKSITMIMNLMCHFVVH